MIIGFEQIHEVREQHPSESIVLAGGVFDLIHPGHLDLFRHMKKAGEIAVIAVSTDQRVRERKGPRRPIQDELTRLTMVGAMRDVDYALLAPEPAPDQEVPTLQVMRALRPDLFMTCEQSWLQHRDRASQHGTHIVTIPRFSEEVSTTMTIDRIVDAYAPSTAGIA